jgi:L,D-peptidoglycan transpeptidase YkuD (ErfK/YbiS/YcfS/YnhG family)
VASYSKIRERKQALSADSRKPSPIVVRARPGHPTQGILAWNNHVFPCALGRGGIGMLKQESDGATPLGSMRLISGYHRHGRLAQLTSRLPLARIKPADGWCDAPGDRNYNRPVTLPYPASSERMERADHLYDCCIVLDYNISPRQRNRGSAIFFHIAKPGYLPTEGCIAVSQQTMARMLPHLSPSTTIIVRR